MADKKGKKRLKLKLNVATIRSQAVQPELQRKLTALTNRTLDLFEEFDAGRLPKEAIALETILSAFSGCDDGLDHSEIKHAYPVQAWREETITLPKALIRVIVEAWKNYKSAPDGKSFGECMHLEGGGQGIPPARRQIKQMNETARLSNRVLVEHLALGAMTGGASWEDAILAVASKESVSDSTVRRASERIRHRTIDRMVRAGWIDEPDA